MALVTLTQAKRHLRIFHDDEDQDILETAEQASEIVVDYIKRPDHGWTNATNGASPVGSTAPMLIQAAVLLMLANLWEHRGDAIPDYSAADGYLPKPVTAILHRFRDPALA